VRSRRPLDDAVIWQRQALEATRRAGAAPLVARRASAVSLYERQTAASTPWNDDDDLTQLVEIKLD
jgi:hypothetical protein